MVLYSTHGHCFGCGAHVPLGKLNINSQKVFTRVKFTTDIPKKLAYITQLETDIIRGIELPFDKEGYYIVYPGVNYYILRKWEGTNANKFQNPAGHKKPLFIPQVGNSTLLLIEGQMNALSAVGITDSTIASPGAATDFNRSDFYKYYLQFKRICVIVDKDAAGVTSGLELRTKLTKDKKQVALYAIKKDLNAILQEKGKQAVKEEIEKALALL